MNVKDALRSVHLFQKKEIPSALSTIWGEQLDPEHVLEEYPRPQMVRNSYINLNGYWDYKIRNNNKKKPFEMHGKILVPFSPEASLSGVGHQLLPGEELICERTLPAEEPPFEHPTTAPNVIAAINVATTAFFIFLKTFIKISPCLILIFIYFFYF